MNFGMNFGMNFHTLVQTTFRNTKLVTLNRVPDLAIL
jgi:hypothetical protein